MPSPAYLELEEFRELTIMPKADLDKLSNEHDGFIEGRLRLETAKLNARLAKRYAVPFQDPVPEICKHWLVAIVTPDCYEKRGGNPDAQTKRLDDARAEAVAQIEEAANSEAGLFELPLRADTTEEGITRGGPFSYSEADPYAWLDAQRDAERDWGR